jgi:hypothetical protein
MYKKGDKIDYTNYCDICLLNVAYKVFAKVMHSRQLPYANVIVHAALPNKVPVMEISNSLCDRFWKKARNLTSPLMTFS